MFWSIVRKMSTWVFQRIMTIVEVVMIMARMIQAISAWLNCIVSCGRGGSSDGTGKVLG